MKRLLLPCISGKVWIVKFPTETGTYFHLSIELKRILSNIIKTSILWYVILGFHTNPVNSATTNKRAHTTEQYYVTN